MIVRLVDSECDLQSSVFVATQNVKSKKAWMRVRLCHSIFWIFLQNRVAVRAVIKFLNAKNVPTAESYRRICTVYGKQNIMSLRHVCKWVQWFKEGRSEVHDDERTGRLSDMLTDDAIAAVCALLEEDRRWIISDLHREIAVRFLIDCVTPPPNYSYL